MSAPNSKHKTTTMRLQIANLAAPVDSAGEWIERDKFLGRKSFGMYECEKCHKTWLSAHAFKDCKQGCQKCEIMVLPTFMWKNIDTFYVRTIKADASPHDSARCEACKKGICKR